MGQYTVQVKPELQTQQLDIDLKNWEQKSSSVKIDVKTGEAQQSIQRLTDGAGQFATQVTRGGQQVITITNNTRQWAEAQQNLRDRVSLSTQQLERMSVTVGNMTDRWGRNVQGADTLNQRIRTLQGEYQNLLSTNTALDSATVRQLNNQQREIQESISLLRTQNQTMSSGSSAITNLVAQYISITAVIQGTISVMRDMVDEVFKLDASLTELAKVSNVAKEDMGALTEQAFKVGEAVSATGKQVIDSVANFKRAGYDMQEAFDLGESALMMKNIADGIDDVDTSSQVIISTLKGFKLSVEDTEHILDALNNVSNNTASSFSGLADVLQRSSATMSDAGNSLEETIGLATGMMEILGQDKSETIGRSLNSITLRLRNLTSVGEDGFEGISKLNKELERMGDKYGTGASIFDNNGNLKTTYEIMGDIAELYPKMTENERQYIAIQSAGEQMTFCPIVQKCA